MNARPSVWGYGIGLGMAVTGGVLAVHVKAGSVVPAWWVFYPSLIVAVTGVVVGLSALGVTVSWGLEVVEKLRVLRQPLVPAVVVMPPQPIPVPDDATEHAWRMALERFFRAGDKAGSFSIRSLQGVVGSSTWHTLTDFYCSLEGGQVLRRVPGDEGTVWGHGWSLDDVTRKLVLGSLPHPAGVVPTVELYVGSTTAQAAKRQRTTAKRAPTVDIEPSRAAE